MHFQIDEKTDPIIQKGSLIQYRLRLKGVPIRWRSVIEDWKENESFIDRQISGPYHFWHHTHEFFPKDGGTLIRDTVRYEIPGGKLGDLVLLPFIKKDLERIFEFRKQWIADNLS